jgi:sugar phosphate isomerase/epimerase
MFREGGARPRMTGSDDNRSERTPRFSISEVTTLAASFEEDLAAYSAAGLDGIGIWELKLPADGDDAAAREAFAHSGLESASAVPIVPSILPLPLLGGPTDPDERIDSLCASIHRLAAFGAPGIVCLTGTGRDLDPDRARGIVAEGLRTIAGEAELAGTRIALEPYQAESSADWSIATDIPAALDLIGEAGDHPALGVQFDVWHLWNSPTVLAEVAREIDRIVGVHISDVRPETRGWADRVLPGDGIADVGGLMAALDAAGWRGLYDLELFSDNGTFGSAYPDSLWDVPAADLAHRGHSALEAAWHARPMLVPALHSNQRKEAS